MQSGGGPPSLLRVGTLVAALLAFLLVGCSEADDGTSRRSEVYVAVLEAIVDAEAGAGPAPEGGWVLYVQSADEDTAIVLEEQVDVVTALAEVAEVRFIDDVEEAIDADTEDSPVRDGGLLVRMGNVPEGGSSLDVYVELYRAESDHRAAEVTVRRQAGDWVVSEPPRPTELR